MVFDTIWHGEIVSDTVFIERRIALLRFLMIFGVVMLHVPPYMPIAQVGAAPFDYVVAFFQHAFFRATVPVLTFISGYLLFRSALDREPARLLRKKARTILVPFLFFNLGLLAVFVLVREATGAAVGNTSTETTRDWLDAAIGLTASPINYPLSFLRDLLVLFVMAPVLGWLLRKAPWAGLLLVVAVFNFNLEGMLVRRDVMAIVFYLGGMAAVLQWNMRALDRYAPALLVLFLGICAFIVYFRVANTHYLRLAAPLLVWPAASLLLSGAVGAWLVRMSKYSFFLFLAHAPILMGMSMVYKKFSHLVPFPVYWLLAPVLVTAIVVVIYELAMRIMPDTFSVLIGASKRRPPGSGAPAASPLPAA